MEYYIRIFSNTAPVQKIKLEQGETLVGRSRSAGIRVKDQDVSGKQFILRLEGDVLSVENISANGTQLDGQMLFENATVVSGQHIRAGEFLDCVIEDEILTRENDIRLSKSDGKGNTSNATPVSKSDSAVVKDPAIVNQPMEMPVADVVREEPGEKAPVAETDKAAMPQIAAQNREEKPITSAGQAADEPREEEKAGTNPGNVTEHNSIGTNPGTNPGTYSRVDGGTSPDTNMGSGTNPDGNTSASSFTGTSHDTNTGTGSEYGTANSSGMTDTNNTGTDHGKTVANKTRVATPDEIKYIKEQKQIRIRRIHTTRMALLFVTCLMIGALCLMKTETSQVKYEWAKDANGKWKTDVITFPGMDWQAEGFAVYFPKYTDTRTDAQADSIVVNTFLGNEKLVEMDVTLDADKDVRHLSRTLEQDLRAWMTTHGVEGAERWTFEAVSQMQFMGADSGLASLCVPYVRETENKARYGLARMFRNGETAYMLRVEVPLEYRLETEHVIEKASFLYVSQKFIQNHWEGGGRPLALDWNELRKIRKKILEGAPGHLADLAQIVDGILIDATMKKDAKKLEYGMEMLQQLRRSQRQCYNTMKIKFINARIERDRKACSKIRDESAAIFAKFGDRRYNDIRNNKW